MDCSHPIHVGGMCANCGAILSDAQVEDAISMMHDTETVTVSRQEAERLDSEATRRLLNNRKLALIVDLDQTIIHATVDPTVGEWLRDPSNPNFDALKGVGAFRLGLDGKAILEDGTGKQPKTDSNKGEDGAQNAAPAAAAADDEGCWYYVKPRPGLAEFLRSLSERYELHVYTMGTRSYADCVCKLVDPDGSLFGTRILSRDENGSLVQKSLSRLFPMDTSMVVIIDDRGDVWGWSPNLIKVIPYDFFIGSGDINATFLPALPSQPATPGAASSESSDTASESKTDGDDSKTTAASSSTSTTNGTSASPSATTTDKQAPSPDSQKAVTEQLNDAAERENEQAADDAAKAQAEQSQKSAVSEQLDARPLAKMQEQLDEKLGVSAASTPEASSTEDDASEGDAAKAAETTSSEEAAKQSQHTQQPDTTVAASNISSSAAEASTSAAAAPPAPAPVPQPRAVLRDEDVELHRVQNILDSIHRQWYSEWDEGAESRAQGKGKEKQGTLVKPEVKNIIAQLKREVLKTCDVVFSSLIPLGGGLQESDYFWLALEYGASCSEELRPETTHVIAAKPGTAKVNSAQRKPGVVVVWPNWLHDSVARWAKQPEGPYLLPRAPPNAEEASSALPTDDELSISDDGEWEDGDLDGLSGGTSADSSAEYAARAAGGDESGSWPGDGGRGLVGMDWAEADKELEEYLKASDDGEDGDDDYEESAAGYTTDGSSPRTPSGRGKRSRRSTPSVNGDTNAPRTPSKLRKSTTSIHDDGDEDVNGEASSHESPKRRRLKDRSVDGGSGSSNGVPPRPRSVASTASNGTGGGGGGDETLLRDLEDELEAALGGESDSDAAAIAPAASSSGVRAD